MPCRQLERTWSPVCQATHNYRQAERMFQRSLGICVAVIPKNLGILKASQRHDAEADLLLNQSLLLRDQNLGHEQLIVAMTMRRIAVSQAIQGYYEDAERFIRRSLEISEKALGTEHPEVVSSRKVFAQVLSTGYRDTEAPWAGLRM